MVEAGAMACALGLTLELPMAVAGLAAAPRRPDGAPVAVSFRDPHELDEGWGATLEKVVAVRDPDGRPRVTVERNARGDHRIWHVGAGTFLLAADARRLECTWPRRRDDGWSQALVEAVLPLAAALRGFAVLRASAVVAGDGVVAVVASTRLERTAVAVSLIAEGAVAYSDDYLALEADGSCPVRAHPGVCAGAPDARVLPLRAIFRLERGDQVERLEMSPSPDAVALLEETVGSAVSDTDRLLRHLATCMAVSKAACFKQVLVPQAMSARETARCLLAAL